MASRSTPTHESESDPLLSKHNTITKVLSNDSYGALRGSQESNDNENSAMGSHPEDEEEVDPLIAQARQRIGVIFAVMSVGCFLSIADSSIVNATYGQISTSFNRLDLAPWISTSFFLALGCTQPLYGKLSDLLGRKPCIIFSYTVFGIGSLLCGLAPSMEMFIAARVVQGLGGGGVGILTTIVFSDLVSIRDRATWQAYLNMVSAFGQALGAPLGGWLADTVGWRWAFYGQVPLIAIAITNIVFLLHLPRKEVLSWRASLSQIDFAGAILLIAFIFCLLFGMDRGSKGTFAVPEAWGPLAAFPVLLVLFIYNEVKLAKNPFLPKHAMTNVSVLAVFAASFLLYGAYASLIFYIPLFFQAVDGMRSAQAGLRVLPASIVGVAGNVAGGLMLKRTGKYYGLLIAGNVLAAFSMIIVVLGTVFLENDTVLVIVGSMLACGNFGMALAGSLIALLANIDIRDQATLTACMFTLRYVGSAVAISACGTLINWILRRDLHATLPSDAHVDEIINGVLESLDYIRHIEPESLRGLVRKVYAGAIRWGFGLQGGLWALAAICCLFISAKRMK